MLVFVIFKRSYDIARKAVEKRCLIEAIWEGAVLCVVQNREGDEVAEVEKKETRKYFLWGISNSIKENKEGGAR
jgi:hypothetical protein